MRWTMTLLIAGLAEAAAQLLTIGWGFAVLLAGFVLVATRFSANIASVNSKAYATEARLTGHIAATAPAVNFVANGGTVGGPVTVNGNHSINGVAFVTNDQHIGGSLYGSGGTLSIGDLLQVNNGGTVNGNFNAAGGITGIFGGTLQNVSGIHTTATLQADNSVQTGNLYVGGQRIAPAQNRPGGYPIVITTYNTGVRDVINAIVTSLLGAGIFV